MVEKIEKDKTGKTFWEEINRGRKNREGIDESVGDKEWKTQFEEQLGGVNERKIVGLQVGGSEQEEREITEEDVDRAIRRLKKRKAPGLDGIPNEAWIYARDILRETVAKVLNKIWQGGVFPEEWRVGVVKPIYKKGCKKLAKNYRPVTLMDIAYKIHAEILRNIIVEKLEEERRLGETQMGFRKGRGTIDAVYL